MGPSSLGAVVLGGLLLKLGIVQGVSSSLVCLGRALQESSQQDSESRWLLLAAAGVPRTSFRHPLCIHMVCGRRLCC